MTASPRFVVLTAILAMTVPVLSLGSDKSNRSKSPCEEKLQGFLHAPNAASLAVLKQSKEDDCWSEIGISNERQQALLKYVASGNIPAAQYLAPHVRRLDGGNLEDALIALGQFSGIHMDALFDLVASGALSDGELQRSLIMLPLTLSDEPDAQLAEMKRRRSQADEVSSTALSRYRKAALASIDAFIAEIERAMPTDPSSATSAKQQH
jgi:hypothetical protein